MQNKETIARITNYNELRHERADENHDLSSNEHENSFNEDFFVYYLLLLFFRLKKILASKGDKWELGGSGAGRCSRRDRGLKLNY